MIEIIICEDDGHYLQKITTAVKQFMKATDVEYKLLAYTDYDDRFMKVLSKDSQKIYILDIETPSRSGIDVARMIRKHDVTSIIIFVTGHEQLGQLVLKRNIMCLAFINKFDNLKESLSKALEDSLVFLNSNRFLRFSDNGISYTIRLNNILYITRDSFDRKLIVKTDNTEYKLRMAIQEMKNLLNDKFVQTCRSCLVNENRVEKIDSKKKTITFDNGLVIDLISDNYKRSLTK